MNELEQKLYQAMDHAAPQELDRILADCGVQNRDKVVPFAPPSRRRRPRMAWAAAAMLAILLCGGFGLRGWQTSHAVASVVSLDVNPSIQLQVNQKEIVLEAQALNAEAEEILEGMDLRKTQLTVAVNAIVGSLLQHGYLDRISTAILISVEDDDVQRASRLETSLTEEVDAALVNASAGAAVLSQTLTSDAALEEQAKSSSISVGKAALVQQVQALNSTLGFDALAALTVEELNQLIQTGAPGMPVGTDAAAAAAQSCAGISDADVITRDVDPELDEVPAHYEVELLTSYGEFEYLVDAYSGAVLSGPANVASAAGAGRIPTLDPGQSIGQEKALSIALADAGVQKENALGLEIKGEYDDGQMLYEVEFRAGGVEYEYEVRASDGRIVKAERDGKNMPVASAGGSQTTSGSQNASGGQTASGTQTGSGAASGDIGAQAAQTAALNHAGVQAGAVSEMKCERDHDDGRTVYEIEFHSGGMEYEYEVDAASGAILKAESEYDD